MEVEKVVYCQKCGTKNPDDANVCKKCKTKLYPLGKAVESEAKTCFGPRKERERHQEECFGLPGGGAIFAVLIGAIIIIVGLSSLLSNVFKWNIELWGAIWPLFIIIVGALIIAGAAYGLSRRK